MIRNNIWEFYLSLRLRVHRMMNRLFERIGVRNDGNDDTMQERWINYLRSIFGNSLKYVIYSVAVFIFLLYALLIQGNEKVIWNSSNNNSVTDGQDVHFPNNTQEAVINGTTNGTLPSTHKYSDSLFSFWLSIGVSILSWFALIQILRYIRNSSFSNNTNYQRQREQMRFLTQLSRANIPGLSTRVRLALLQRDFTGDDYEMLQQLDDARFNGGPVVSHGAPEASIQRLPLHTLTAADFQDGNDSALGSCNICLAPYEIGDEVRTVVCLHKFHKECIDPWLRTKNICPICKYPATDTQQL